MGTPQKNRNASVVDGMSSMPQDRRFSTRKSITENGRFNEINETNCIFRSFVSSVVEASTAQLHLDNIDMLMDDGCQHSHLPLKTQ